MPQPYKGRFRVEDRDALTQRPELAKHVGIIASQWAFLEARLADLLGAMLRADKYIGALMFMQIKSEPARLAVMQAVAEDRLSPAMLERFTEIKKRVGRTGSQRDRLVHGLWALPDEKPDSILLIDSRHAAMLMAAADVLQRKGARRTSDDLYKHPGVRRARLYGH